MEGIERVTRQLLDILEILLQAYVSGEDLHGYEMMKRTGLSGASTYRNLDRLEDAQLVKAHWEVLGDDEDRPRRRYYRLDSNGAAFAWKTLEERRPEALKRLDRRRRGLEPRPGLIMPFPQSAGDAGGAL